MRPPRLPAELRLAVLQQIGPGLLAEIVGGLVARALAGDERAAALVWQVLASELDRPPGMVAGMALSTGT